MDEEKFNKIVAQLLEAGATRQEAVAVACAFEHAMECNDFKVKYGTRMRDTLQTVLNKA